MFTNMDSKQTYLIENQIKDFLKKNVQVCM